MATIRKLAPLIAAILVMATGGLLVLGRTPWLGVILGTVGLGAAIVQVRTLMARREDPYDLSRLFDAPLAGEDKPEEEFTQADDVPFCYHCGHAVAKPFGHCPECGNSVR